ncbi:hypothetical protein HH310_04425 [Actinoplanes sp. TBRC 11911]|uniref:hypothetical protein n=1 Tax=Actinoplanes sp. TBRC 11911 TaxID=2729386 RepID=UPI00145E5234|nr:hypothetical protein [Actinoplanes sp. TBRC 11911]NMO50437.1 hypothetical protein [Actinoplanes sp. TBRC 11911]
MTVEPQAGETRRERDAVWSLSEPASGVTDLLVEAKTRLLPRQAAQVFDGPATRRALDSGATLLVVAPWLSRRTQEVLERRGVSFLDLAGNVSLTVRRPTVFVRTQGSDRDPSPHPQPAPTLRGPKARRLVRTLTDFQPPYRLTALAEFNELSLGYVSKLIDRLNDEAILDRPGRGEVERVDWPTLLMAAAQEYTPWSGRSAWTFVSPSGAAKLYERLTDPGAPETLVTASFAARIIAPISGAAQLVLYCDDPDAMRTFGRLVPSNQGADVVLIRPDDRWVRQGARTVDGVKHVAPSQLVLDCANGPGRVPEQGRAVVEWMRGHEDHWRNPMLTG